MKAPVHQADDAPAADTPGDAWGTPADRSTIGNATITLPRPQRRLSDKILALFHQACDQEDYDVAEQMLRVCEFMLGRPTTGTGRNRRHNLDSLVAAHERLWHLRHPDAS